MYKTDIIEWRKNEARRAYSTAASDDRPENSSIRKIPYCKGYFCKSTPWLGSPSTWAAVVPSTTSCSLPRIVPRILKRMSVGNKGLANYLLSLLKGHAHHIT
uniref:Uncharacterized protein n=1 Tax=Romanomermis culicivorax TaxID=13658 RepID=A0A915HXH9_ROMCU